jgi:hypothetical protein
MILNNEYSMRIWNWTECTTFHTTNLGHGHNDTKQAGFYGEPFASIRGVRQGDFIYSIFHDIQYCNR